jgi:hypothetical protein
MLPYGKDFAWISMVLVMEEYRRQGLARRLLDRCVSDIRANNMTPVLDATPAGRAVYLGMGCRDTWGFQRLMHRNWQPPAAEAGSGIRRITDADWPELCSYDARMFGADRSAVLGRLRGRMPRAEFVAYRKEQIAGFLLGRDGQTATQLGPLVADDEATAQALLDRGLGAIEGTVYLDLADTKTALHASLLKRGFEVQRPFTRMVFGRDRAFDDPARTFAVAGPELG